jgi:hypothetical protein
LTSAASQVESIRDGNERRARAASRLGSVGSKPPSLPREGQTERGPVVITDLKTGIDYPEHREEVRYYALLETLKTGVPPIRVASYYLDGGWFQPEDVNEDVLRSAVRRTADAVNLIAQLWWREREPALSPGWHCRYCPAEPDCAEGSRWLDENQGRLQP